MTSLEIWPHLRLRTKGLIVIAVPAAATVLIACASYVLGARASTGEEAVKHSLETGLEIQRLKANEAETSAHLRAYFITGEADFQNQARRALAAFDSTLQKLSGLAAGSAFQTRQVSEIAALQRSRMEQLFSAAAQPQSGIFSREAWSAALQTQEAWWLQMERAMSAAEGEQSRLLEVQSRDVERLRMELRATTGICMILGVVGGIVISLLFASGITNRIGKLQDNVSRLATGSVLEPLPGGRDEIGALSEGVARTAEILRQRTGALENALHGIAQVDHAGRYLSFNKAYAEIANLSDCNQPASVIFTVFQDDRAQVEAAIQEMRACGLSETELRIAGAGGSLLDVAMTFRPVSQDPGAGYYVFLRDISRRKKTEAALVRAKDEALASSLAKNDFLAKISHDIRTPLNAILGAANLLSETSLSPDQSEYVSMFQRNCARLVKLINDFLDFSKIEAGALRLEKVPFRIRGAVEDAVATFRESASRKRIGLEFEIDSEVPAWALGDPLRVQQVLVNLLSNALKFTKQGQVAVRVTLSTSADERLCYEVSDTGPGIEAADQERVFSAFTQLSKQSPTDAAGCGLGLTICRELVELMGGEIGVTSQPGRGSRFYFTLPLEAAEPLDTGADGSPSQAIPEPPQSCTVRLLVAEDTEDNRLLVTHYLRKEPIELSFAEDGQSAADAIVAGAEFDLILMDLDMPRMDGYGATRFIREWQRSHGQAPTPIVALSGHAMRDAQQASQSAGCTAHVAKPVDQATLLSTVHRYARPKSPRPPQNAGLEDGIEALIPKYLASKPLQIEQAQASLAIKDFDPIRRFGHNLKGTGGGYGFPPIETIGRELEKAATERDEVSISRQLDNLRRFVSEVDAPILK